MGRLTLLVTTPKLAHAGAECLRASGARVMYVGADNPEADLARLLANEPVDGVLSRTLPLDAGLIASCPSLRAISRHGVGYDGVDMVEASRRAIPVSVAAGTNAVSVAEQAMALILAVARRVPRLDGAIRAGGWPRSDAGLQLCGRRLGLVGFGRIARLLAVRAQAFGLDVHVFDPMLRDTPEGVRLMPSLQGLLSVSDILSLHCPLSADTNGLIGASELALLPANAIVVNTARGGLIDEPALAQALASGHLWGAGLDTLETEPPAANNPLLHRPEVVFSPHVGGNTAAALEATALSAAKNLLALLGQGTIDPALIVNASALARKETE